jgi:hypothetical protein
MPKDFYRLIVVPMMKICANRQFYVHSFVEKIGLCARVKKVTELFIGLNGGQQPNNNKNGEEISSIDIFAFALIIIEMAFHDLFKLQADQKIAYDVKVEIQDEAMKIANPKRTEDKTFSLATYSQSMRVDLAKAFGEAFGQIVNVGEDGTIESQKAVYKLLCIGYHMRVEYWKVEENLTWAFQQTVVNLAIHALRLDPPSQGEIQKIVASWPIGMLKDETIVEPSQGHDSA